MKFDYENKHYDFESDYFEYESFEEYMLNLEYPCRDSEEVIINDTSSSEVGEPILNS